MERGKLWGQLIKAAREASGLTQRELAEKVGVRQASIARWELGETGIRDAHKAKVAGALGQTVESLFPWVSA